MATFGQTPGESSAGRRIAWALAAGKLVLHLVVIRGYGIFRDELYYLDTARHLDWGYVDQPPLIAAVAWLTSLFGDSLLAIRLPAALAGAALVLLTAALAREMGGGAFAQGIAALAVVVAPGYLLFHHILTMNAFEPLFWMGAAWVVLRYLKTRDPRLWIAFGGITGLGLLNKHSMAFYAFALVAGLLLAGEWRIFKERGLWLGAIFGVMIFLPHLVWQVRHDFPQLEILRVTRAHRDVRLSPGVFLLAQVQSMNPASVPLWLSGLVFYFTRRGRAYRPLGWSFLVVLGTFLAMQAKFYYLWPAYPVLFAGGGILLESVFAPRSWRWLRPLTAGAMVAGGALLAPFMLPVLPVERFVRYARALGFEEIQTENQRQGALPQWYADMHGWKEMAQAVARVYETLPPEERARAVVFGQDFGQAGAINHFGPALGIPRAISGHNSYYLWGPGDATGEIVIVIGDEKEDLQRGFEEVEAAGITDHPWARPDEVGLTIWICRKPRLPMEKLWPLVRSYD
jgi:hypothetical protein